MPGPEEPEQAPPSPDYFPGPEHVDDKIVAEDQPYAKDASPIAQSPEYDDDDEDPEEDPIDYPADGGDDGDDEEDYTTTTPCIPYDSRISILAPVPMPAWTDSEVIRLLAISSSPASPLSPWSSPPPQIPFPPSPILAPAPPPSPIRSLGYRAAMIRLRDEVASTSHSPPSQLPSASRREDRPEVTLPPQK
nr:hypothetical protein [Tanacetum cinerariifolium]